MNDNITTDNNGDVTLTGAVELDTAAITIDTSATTSGDGGVVTFTSTLENADATGRNLIIRTNASAVDIQGLIGGTNPIGTLTINDRAADTGNITLTGIGDSAGLGATTTAIGNAKTAGTVTLAGDDYHTGAATYTGGSFSITGTDPEFKTTNLAIEFAAADTTGGDVTLADAADLSVATGNAGITFGGDILGTDNGRQQT